MAGLTPMSSKLSSSVPPSLKQKRGEPTTKVRVGNEATRVNDSRAKGGERVAIFGKGPRIDGFPSKLVDAPRFHIPSVILIKVGEAIIQKDRGRHGRGQGESHGAEVVGARIRPGINVGGQFAIVATVGIVKDVLLHLRPFHFSPSVPLSSNLRDQEYIVGGDVEANAETDKTDPNHHKGGPHTPRCQYRLPCFESLLLECRI